jgi:hypothetical protein
MGTAHDMVAHQDMHKQQAKVAQEKRDKACNSSISAQTERNSMVIQVKAAIASHAELMKFAKFKEQHASSKSITSDLQKQECLARNAAASAANKRNKVVAKPQRVWRCEHQMCRMRTIDVPLYSEEDCDIWTDERA